MTSESADDLYALKGRDLEEFGFARVRDIAYDAVQELWRRRKAEGWTQIRLAENLGRDTGWLSRYLRGPGNWTFSTFGALVQGLEGQAEIIVRPFEEIAQGGRNHSPYSAYVLDVRLRPAKASSDPEKVTLFGNSAPKANITNSVGELV